MARKRIPARRGQTIIEYSVLIMILAGALLAASVYTKRGIQARWKENVDDFGDQYDPRTANTDVTFSLTGNSLTSIRTFNTANGFVTRRTDTSFTTERKTGTVRVEN
jgi:Flp pilus assembly pilin Flp